MTGVQTCALPILRWSSGFRTVPLAGDRSEMAAQLTTTLEVALTGIDDGLFPRWPARECRYCDAAESCAADPIAFKGVTT